MPAMAPDAPTTGTGELALNTACVTDAVRWGFTGGRSPTERRSQVDPCRDYELTEFTGGFKSSSCTSLVACTGAGIAVTDLETALTHPDVLAAVDAAMAMGGDVVYGRDTRPVDGSILQIQFMGYDIFVGSDCGSTTPCTAIPPGVAALRDVLIAVEADRIASEDCRSTFPDG